MVSWGLFRIISRTFLMDGLSGISGFDLRISGFESENGSSAYSFAVAPQHLTGFLRTIRKNCEKIRPADDFLSARGSLFGIDQPLHVRLHHVSPRPFSKK